MNPKGKLSLGVVTFYIMRRENPISMYINVMMIYVTFDYCL